MFSRKSLHRWAVFFISLSLFACGGGGGGGGGSTSLAVQNVAGPTIAGNNVMAVVVNGGLSGLKNRLYATVTVCNPSSSSCATIDNILVDTGSYGLRLMHSTALSAIGFTPETVGGQPLMNCVNFLDNSNMWGSVQMANVQLGGLTTSSPIPIQIVADPATPYTIPATCGSASGSLTTASGGSNSLGANGILGIGTYTEDCGTYCANVSGAGWYYTCPNNSCSATTVPVANQLQNPVPHFPTDNNGLIVVLPSVPAAGAVTVNGSVIFGVGTEINNQLDSTDTLLQTSIGNYAHISTQVSAASLSYGPVTMNNSILDTGSNGLFFGTVNTPVMPVGFGWYAPALPVTLTATLSGSNNVPKTIAITVSDNSKASDTTYARPTQAAPLSDSTMFDWGLPFYYGRRVFLGIDNMPATDASNQTITGPYYAF